MDSKKSSSPILFLLVNLLFFVLVNGCNTPNPPMPKPTPTPSSGSCPRDALKLGVCAKLLNGSVGTVIGNPPAGTPCCAILGGLLDLEAAVCLCTALKANILGINLNIPISLSLLISSCGKEVPPGFKCSN